MLPENSELILFCSSNCVFIKIAYKKRLKGSMSTGTISQPNFDWKLVKLLFSPYKLEKRLRIWKCYNNFFFLWTRLLVHVSVEMFILHMCSMHKQQAHTITCILWPLPLQYKTKLQAYDNDNSLYLVECMESCLRIERKQWHFYWWIALRNK